MAIISGYETESDLGTGYELNRINVIVISNDKIENHSCSELKLTNEEKNDY